MKNRILAIGGLATLLGATTAFGVMAQSPPTASNPLKRHAGARERHPEMVRALRALERAKDALQHADRDFGGHREQALDLSNKAIDEVKAGIQSDKK